MHSLQTFTLSLTLSEYSTVFMSSFAEYFIEKTELI